MTAGDSALAAVLKRDRLIVGLALAAIGILAWCYILELRSSMMAAPSDMGGMPMNDTSHVAMAAFSRPQSATWSVANFALMFAMWSTMMVGMMTPSVAPMVLTYAAIARRARARGTAFAPAFWFVFGYLFAWTLFSVLAMLGQYGLDRALALSPEMTLVNKYLAGATLVTAGLYQWTPLKHACLSNCRAPLSFVQSHGGFQPGALGSVRLGLEHGLYCIGCCWFIMALLFVGGVMNILWIAALTATVFMEKLFPAGLVIARALGVGAAAAGFWMIVH